jgi:PKD domain
MRAAATRTRAALAAVVALLCVPAAAHANDEIRVEPEGSAARTLMLSGLGAADVQEREYTFDDGSGERRVAITGWSLDLVLRKAGPDADPYRFAGMEVTVAGADVALDREEVTRAGAFPDGPPVFWMENGELRFLRPAGDGAGPVLLAGPGPATVRLDRMSELRVRAEASDRRVEPGDRVTFTANVEGASEGQRVDVSWYFDDGRRGSGARVTHRFRKPGTYKVSVGARTSSDDPGADDFVTVRVGKPPDGPDREGGGTNPDARAPDSGAGTGPSGPGGSGPGNGTGGSPNDGGESGADDAPPAREETERRRREEPEREADPADRPGGRQVNGIELADLSALSSDAGRDALRAARRGNPRAENEDSGMGIPPALWWTLGTAALLGLGGWREARGRPAARVT